MNPKNLILSLIRDDLINSKLVYSLEKIGLKADDYLLHLPETILQLMGHTVTDELIEHYLQLSFPIRDIDIFDRSGSLDRFSEELFDEIELLKKPGLIIQEADLPKS